MDTTPVPGVLLGSRDRQAALTLACDGKMNSCRRGSENTKAGMKESWDIQPLHELALSAGPFHIFVSLIQHQSRLGQVSGSA